MEFQQSISMNVKNSINHIQQKLLKYCKLSKWGMSWKQSFSYIVALYSWCKQLSTGERVASSSLHMVILSLRAVGFVIGHCWDTDILWPNNYSKGSRALSFSLPTHQILLGRNNIWLHPPALWWDDHFHKVICQMILPVP